MSEQQEPVAMLGGIIAALVEQGKAPKSCPHCIDETDCASVDICNAVTGMCSASSTDQVIDKSHKVMTPEEYAVMPIIGWHEVCRDIDGFGGTGIRFIGESSASSTTHSNTVADSSGSNPGAIGASKEAGGIAGFATVASASDPSSTEGK